MRNEKSQIRNLQSAIRNGPPDPCFEEKPTIGLRNVLRALKRRFVPADNRTKSLSALQARLEYTFSDPALLNQALKHRSYVYAVAEGSIASNERLEFLGDAVLDLPFQDGGAVGGSPDVDGAKVAGGDAAPLLPGGKQH